LSEYCPECRREVSENDRFCPFCGYPLAHNPSILQEEYDHIEYLVDQAHGWVDQGIVFPIVVDTIEEVYRDRQEKIKLALEKLPEQPVVSLDEPVSLVLHEEAAAEKQDATTLPYPELVTDHAFSSEPETAASPAGELPAQPFSKEVGIVAGLLKKAGSEEFIKWGVWLSAGFVLLAVTLLLGESLLVESQLKAIVSFMAAVLVYLAGWGLVRRDVRRTGIAVMFLGQTGMMVFLSRVVFAASWGEWQTGLALGFSGLGIFLGSALITGNAIFAAIGAVLLVLSGTAPFFASSVFTMWWPGVLGLFSCSILCISLLLSLIRPASHTLCMRLDMVGRTGIWLAGISLLHGRPVNHSILAVSWLILGLGFLLSDREKRELLHQVPGFAALGAALTYLFLSLAPWLPSSYSALFLSGCLLAACGAATVSIIRPDFRKSLILGGTVLMGVSLIWCFLVFAARGRQVLGSLGFLTVVSGIYCLLLQRMRKPFFSRQEAHLASWLFFSAALIACVETIAYSGSYVKFLIYCAFGVGSYVLAMTNREHLIPGVVILHLAALCSAAVTSIGLPSAWFPLLFASCAVACFIRLAQKKRMFWLVYMTVVPIFIVGYRLTCSLHFAAGAVSVWMIVFGWLYVFAAVAIKQWVRELVAPLRLTGNLAVCLSCILFLIGVARGEPWSASSMTGLLAPYVSCVLAALFWVVWSVSADNPRIIYLAGVVIAAGFCLAFVHIGFSHWIFYAVPWSALVFLIRFTDRKWKPQGWIATYRIPDNWKSSVGALIIMVPGFIHSLTSPDPFLGTVEVVLISSVFLLSGLVMKSKVWLSMGLFFLGLEVLVLLTLSIPFQGLGWGEILLGAGLTGLIITVLLQRNNRQYLGSFFTLCQKRVHLLLSEFH